MTPGDRAAAEFRKKDALHAVCIHGAMGIVFGAMLGLWLWFKWDWRLRVFWHSAALDSVPALFVFVCGFSVLFGALAACLKDRFWYDWRSPFWWP